MLHLLTARTPSGNVSLLYEGDTADIGSYTAALGLKLVGFEAVTPIQVSHAQAEAMQLASRQVLAQIDTVRKMMTQAEWERYAETLVCFITNLKR